VRGGRPGSPEVTVFDHYASYYDLFYSGKDYGAEARYVTRHLREFGAGTGEILELGCGTGAHAAELARAGYEVTGVDLSERMLARANTRLEGMAAPERAKLRFVHGDARNARLDRRFDAVISLFHVMSYQNSNDDLLAAFSTAARHLSPGGVFLFDFWYGPAVLTQRPETRVHDLQNAEIRVTRVARPRLRENENIVDVGFTVLIEDKATGTVKRLEETHVMRYLFLPEIDYLLERSGMRRECAKEWMTDNAPSLASWGGFVVARRLADAR
jgi:SAM-dependent methyltransferase